ncbi:MAG: hypothetical protein AB7K24_30195 [Gemmataceae bacterium]
MIGGAPIFAPQMMPQSYAPYPAPQYAPAPTYQPPQPRYQPPPQAAPRQPIAQAVPQSRPQAAPPSQATRPALPPPRIRAQSGDEQPAPTASRIQLPSPEALGLSMPSPASTASADLAAVQRRLDSLGARCFHLDRVHGKRQRLVCLFETGEAGRLHRIEAEADSAVEAARLVLQRAHTWKQTAAR